MDSLAGRRIETIEPGPLDAKCPRADPKLGKRIFKNEGDGIIAQAVRIVRIMGEVIETLMLRSVAVQPAEGSHPEYTTRVFFNRSYNIITEAGWFLWIMTVTDKGFGDRV